MVIVRNKKNVYRRTKRSSSSFAHGVQFKFTSARGAAAASVADRDQVVAELLHNVDRCAGLHAFPIHANDDRLGRLDYHAPGIATLSTKKRKEKKKKKKEEREEEREEKEEEREKK